MKTYTVHLSDEDVERLRLAAEARHQTPDEALQATVEDAIRAGMLATDLEPSPQLLPPPAPANFTDPWAGFRGKFLADTPDIFERHDAYIGEAALETHADGALAPEHTHDVTIHPATEPAEHVDGNQ